MIYLSQRDPKWAAKTIGKSTSTIGRYGCVITCISMLSDWYGCYQNPGWMAKNLSFLRDLLIWSSVEKKLCFRFVKRYYKKDMAAFKAAMAGKDTACLLHVHGNHWVIGIRKSTYPWSRWWLTVDPWIGGKKWYHENEIVGGATFTR